MSLHRRPTSGRSRHAKRCLMEALENRQLLTGLAGGDVFEFMQTTVGATGGQQQGGGQQVRIVLSGNVIAEFIGAVVDDQNQLILTDLPGRFFTSPRLNVGANGMDVLGGIGGKDGCDPVTLDSVAGAPTFIVDPAFAGGNIPVGGEVNLRGLAASAAGATYAINVGNNNGRKLVQLVNLNNNTGAGTVTSMFQGATLREDTMFTTRLTNVRDMAFDATTGLLYALNEEAGGSVLYAIDLADPVPATAVRQIGAVFNLTTNRQLRDVQAMAFDDQGQLYVLVQDYDGDPGTDASGLPIDNPQPPALPSTSNTDVALIRLKKDDPSFTNADAQVVTAGGLELTDPFTAMTFDPGNRTLLAVARTTTTTGGTGGTGGTTTIASQLYRIQPATAIATGLGAIQAGGATQVDGLAWGVDIDDNAVLVGLDNGQSNQQGQVQPRLLAVNAVDAAQSSALNEAGSTVLAGGLASYTLPGDSRPLLYSIGRTSGTLVRGSSVHLGVSATGTSTVASINGADFNPLDNQLYFIANVDIGGARYVLHRADVNAANRSAIQNSLMREAGRFDRDVTSMAFDQTSPTTALLYYYDNSNGHLMSSGVVAAANPQTGAATVNIAAMNIANAADLGQVSEGGQAIANGLTGLAFFDPDGATGEDPGAAEQFIYASQQSGATSRLLRIRIQAGGPTAMAWGLLPDADDKNKQRRGEDIQGLTWNPGIFNPFTLERGALLGTDVTRDELVFIDYRMRPTQVNVFDIYVTQADADSYITMASVPSTGNVRNMQPFAGNAGDIRVYNYAPTGNNDAMITVSADDGTGTVYIGARTRDLDAKNANDDLLPITQNTSAMTKAFGMRPMGNGYLTAGVHVPTNLVSAASNNTYTGYGFSQYMLGQNLDRVDAMSVAYDGTIALADNDRTDTMAQRVGAQLSLVLPGYGNRAYYVADIYEEIPDPATPGATMQSIINTIVALDYNHPAGTEPQTLYAVAMIDIVDPVTSQYSRLPVLGTIDADPYSMTYGRFNRIGAVGGGLRGVMGMAFSPDRHLFVVDDQSTLYEIDPANGYLIDIRGTVQDATGRLTIKSMDFDNAGHLYAHDLVNGRLVSIDTDTGQVGNISATAPGSVRATVGAVSFNPAAAGWLSVDNALGRENLGIDEATYSYYESAMLLPLRGFTNDAAVPQDLGKMLVGGTLTGEVDISGSSNLFYAGWLVTGRTQGITSSTVDPVTGQPLVTPPSFRVGGEIRDLIVRDSIGTDDASALTGTRYRTDFFMTVGSKAGQIATRQSLLGQVDVSNVLGGRSLGTPQIEVEARGSYGPYLPSVDNPYTGLGYFVNDFENGNIGYDGAFYNDSFDTAQYLGTIDSTDVNIGLGTNVVQVRGALVAQTSNKDESGNDWWDYYAVSLMAGQTVQVQLVDYYTLLYGEDYAYAGTFGYLNVGVFDPDGRQIASDYSDQDWLAVQNKPFQFTADRPGLYRFVVGGNGDCDFAGNEFSTYSVGDTPYELRIWGAGDIALGAISASSDIYDGRRDSMIVTTPLPGTTPTVVLKDASYRVRRGDLGGIRSGGTLASTAYPLIQDPNPVALPPLPGQPPLPPPLPPLPEDVLSGATIQVDSGNLRSIDATSIGREWLNLYYSTSYEVSLEVPNGSVGLLRATGTKSATGSRTLAESGDTLGINQDFYLDQNSATVISNAALLSTPREVAIGGDYQLVDAANGMYANLWADGNIGVVRAGRMNDGPGSFVVNADGDLATPGIIDLIDVAGDLGRMAGGGPGIMTGWGGNLRYLRVGGRVYRDRFFGSGQPEETLFDPGESVTLNDDSGAWVTISPTPTTGVVQPPPQPGQPPLPPALPNLRITTYGIRGSGGSAIAKIISSGGVNLTSNGGPLSGVEIGLIDAQGGGQPVIQLPNGTWGVDPLAGTPLEVMLSGTTKVDVLQITGGEFTTVANATAGEILNIDATSIGRLAANDIGITRRGSTSAAVNSLRANPLNAFPFSQQRNAIVLSGDLGLVQATGSIGNLSVGGTIGLVVADSDRVHLAGFEGIAGPISAGALPSVDVGMGILPSGNGNLSHAGLYATGIIGQVRGKGAIIRGNIVSQSRIDNVAITDGGSIINANIMVLGTLDQSRDFLFPGYSIGGPGGSVNNPTYAIGNITVQGALPQRLVTRNRKGKVVIKYTTPRNGGIIGLNVMGASIGNTTVTRGFGLINSAYTIVGDGRIGSFNIDGYGIRDVVIQAGASVGPMTATGVYLKPVKGSSGGTNIPVTSYSPFLRQSEFTTMDPFFNTAHSRLTDLHSYFRTTRQQPAIAGLTNSGIIAGTSVKASRDLGLVKAWRIAPSEQLLPLTAPTTTPPALGYVGTPSNFAVANSMKGFLVGNDIIGTQITTGSLLSLSIGRHAVALSTVVAGLFSDIKIGGSVDAKSMIGAVGPNGQVGKAYIKGNLAGTLSAERRFLTTPVIGGTVTGRVIQTGLPAKFAKPKPVKRR